ncbi:hypothetical protein IJ818_01895 [bacterium]|nr:hypothetical protein [bacterium]
MQEEKKSRYTPAQAKAAKKYLANTFDDIKIRVPKGKREYYKSVADNSGESLNHLFIRAIDTLIENENLSK